METKKPAQPQIQAKKLTDRDKKLAVRNAVAREINFLVVQVQDMETRLRPMKQKIAYLRTLLGTPTEKPATKKPAKKAAKPITKAEAKVFGKENDHAVPEQRNAQDAPAGDSQRVAG